jgi:hypothetical protein
VVLLDAIRSRCSERHSRLAAAVVLATLGLALPAVSEALTHQKRPDWMIGVGMGYGRGQFEGPGGQEDSYRNGAVPGIYFGRMLGQHLMVGGSYEGWMLEFGGTVNDTVAVKFRRSLQNVGFAVTVFPGNPENATGGIYLRATVGAGWAGTAALAVHAEEAQHNAPRVDEWGVGASAGVGYEFWIIPRFTAGLGLSFDYLDIGEQIVDRGRFGGLLLNVNLYF